MNQKWQPQQRKKQESVSTSTTASAADNMWKERSSKTETLKLKLKLKLKLIRRGRHEDRNFGFCCSWFSSFFELSFLNQKEGIVQWSEKCPRAVGRKFGGGGVGVLVKRGVKETEIKCEEVIKSRTRELAVYWEINKDFIVSVGLVLHLIPRPRYLEVFLCQTFNYLFTTNHQSHIYDLSWN
jgi:hypothetical protein